MVVADTAENLALLCHFTFCLAIPVTMNMRALFVHANRDQPS